MAKRHLLLLPTFVTLFFVGDRFTGAQDDSTNIRVNVDLVQLNVAVTDSKGNYVSGLGPENFVITEDKIPERIATFEEGNEPARQVLQPGANASPGKPAAAPSPQPTAKSNSPVVQAKAVVKSSSAIVGEDVATIPAQITGANVFVLFDTSNYMYRGFVFAQDAITDFVRSLEGANRSPFTPTVVIFPATPRLLPIDRRFCAGCAARSLAMTLRFTTACC